jgi:hypothetical protein
MKRVLVFKTSVQEQDVSRIWTALNHLVGAQGKWNFDLEDCDRILRIETPELSGADIAAVIQRAGYFCEELAD